MILKNIIVLFIVAQSLFSQETFSVDSIRQYLTQENPFVYSNLGKKHVNEEKLNYAFGNYDTKVVAKYEDKEYPVTYGKYYSLGIEKPLENGIDVSLSYRYADGTQEYNNIKTSEDGEIIAGVKVPVLKVLNKIDKRRLDVGLASLNVVKSDFQYQDSMRNLYFIVMTNYYKLIYAKEVWVLSKELLLKVQKRHGFIQRRVQEGLEPQMKLIEVEQQVINIQQMVLTANTNYDNQFEHFLKFLNISREDFSNKFSLEELPKLKISNVNFANAMDTAIENRVDLKMIANEIKKYDLKQKYNKLLKYPNLDVGMYGVYDLNKDVDSYEQSGYKLTVNMSFPIEQRKYSGKKLENKYSVALLDANKNKLLIELRTNLKNTITSLYALEKNVENSNKEVALVKKLENLEKKKYELGSSTLFMLNQREMQTLKTQKKFLKYKLDELLNHQQYIKEINLYPL